MSGCVQVMRAPGDRLVLGAYSVPWGGAFRWRTSDDDVCVCVCTCMYMYVYVQVMKLRELARNPYDLSAKEAVNPKRIQSMQMSACGIKVYAVCVCVCT